MKVLMIAMLVFALSGASAGLLGIGGALIFNPYLLQLGMDPRVSAPISPPYECMIVHQPHVSSTSAV